MPQIDWTPEHKRNTNVEFDRLKLKVGEKARIVALEKPTFTWVHTLRAPKIVNGEANKVIKRRKDGSEFADWDMDFIGRPQCLGDHGIIADEGLDPKNCPVCARAKESEETSAPERRFAMNVIRYNTRADGTPVNPFGCSSVVWTFTEGIFNKLYDISQEYGGLTGRDLILGPCEAPEAYQKFPIQGGMKNLWESEDSIRNTVMETHKHNRVEDLEGACGRKVQERFLKEDINKIRDRWKIAHGEASGASTQAHDVASLKGELDNLLAPAPAPVTVNPELVTRVDLVPASTSLPPQKTSIVSTDGSAPTDQDDRKLDGGSDPEDFSKLLANLNL